MHASIHTRVQRDAFNKTHTTGPTCTVQCKQPPPHTHDAAPIPARLITPTCRSLQQRPTAEAQTTFSITTTDTRAAAPRNAPGCWGVCWVNDCCRARPRRVRLGLRCRSVAAIHINFVDKRPRVRIRSLRRQTECVFCVRMDSRKRERAPEGRGILADYQAATRSHKPMPASTIHVVRPADQQ